MTQIDFFFDGAVARHSNNNCEKCLINVYNLNYYDIYYISMIGNDDIKYQNFLEALTIL